MVKDSLNIFGETSSEKYPPTWCKLDKCLLAKCWFIIVLHDVFGNMFDDISELVSRSLYFFLALQGFKGCLSLIVVVYLFSIKWLP